MKIALIQHNPIIGDWTGNCKQILKGVKEAAEKECELAILPELAIAGFPAKDLYKHRSFIHAERAALEELIEDITKQCPKIAVLVGVIYTERSKVESGAALFYKNKTLFFTKSDPPLFSICDNTFAIIIGEEYSNLTQIRQTKDSPSTIINIAASYFTINKPNIRKQIITQLSKEYAVNFLFCNQVGGMEERIFDGSSIAVNKDGEVLAQAKSFAEDILIFDTEKSQKAIQSQQETKTCEDAQIYQALVLGVRDYIYKSGFSSALLGLSGGIDSALTVAIAVDALGAENVMGIAMPSPYSSPESIQDAEQLGKNLNCRFEMQPIGELFSAFNAQLAPLFTGKGEDVTEQNLQARIRGNILMAVSNKLGAMLLSTGNRSESAVGYCTLYGDMCGGLAVIGDLSKHRVYALSRYVNRQEEIIPERILTKAPSAELKPGQKDQDELPDYDTLDEIIRLYLEEKQGAKEIIDKGFAQDEVEDVLRRIRLNEYKRRQAALTLCISEQGFGCGWDYPVLHKFMG